MISSLRQFEDPLRSSLRVAVSLCCCCADCGLCGAQQSLHYSGKPQISRKYIGDNPYSAPHWTRRRSLICYLGCARGFISLAALKLPLIEGLGLFGWSMCSQYFLWWLCLLPFAVAATDMKKVETQRRLLFQLFLSATDFQLHLYAIAVAS